MKVRRRLWKPCLGAGGAINPFGFPQPLTVRPFSGSTIPTLSKLLVGTNTDESDCASSDILALVFAQAHAGRIFHGYESYYLSKGGAIFKKSDARSLQQFLITFDYITIEESVFDWKGKVGGKNTVFRWSTDRGMTQTMRDLKSHSF